MTATDDVRNGGATKGSPTGDRRARFWDRIAARYARSPIADQTAYEEKLRRTRVYFTPESEALEIGCGTGSTAILHAPHVKRIRAVDISPAMLEIARGRAAKAGVENVRFEQASLDELAIDAETVDVAFALSLLHLLDDRRAAIAKIFSGLKPGGVFVTSTACLADGMNFLRPVVWVARQLGKAPPVTFFTADQLAEEVAESGFEIVERWRPGKRKALFMVARKPARRT